MAPFLFVFIAGLYFSLPSADACSCLSSPYSHPVDLLCTSDFVIVATITDVHNIFFIRTYDFELVKEFKVSTKAGVALKSKELRTTLSESVCGVNLKKGKTYLLGGRINHFKAELNLCTSVVYLWSGVPEERRRGLKRLHKQESCEISGWKSGTNFVGNNSVV